jgi:hypothetical protein
VPDKFITCERMRDSKGGAMSEAQFRRRGPRAGVATEEAEADESCDRILSSPHKS